MSQLPSDLLLGDLDVMFCAVTARLRRIAAGSGAPAVDTPDRVLASVLECVAALDQLHEILAQEVERAQRVEQLITDAQAALARAPPELVSVLGLTLRVPTTRLVTRAPDSARAA